MPQFVITHLGSMGFLVRRRNVLSPRIQPYFLDRDLHPLMGALKQVIGADYSGPRWCVCKCPKCQEREGQADRTDEPGMMRARASMLGDEAITAIRRSR